MPLREESQSFLTNNPSTEVMAVSKLFFAISILFYLLILITTPSSAHSAPVLTDSVVTIKYPSPHEVSIISRYELYMIFTRRSRIWGDGTPIIVVMMDENNVNHKIFVSTVLGTSTLQFNRMIRREMSSDSRGIFIADSPQSAINKISQTTGAIGYVNGLVYLNNSHLVERIEVRY